MHISQLRSELFSEWEKRLRGWDVYPYTVNIEPEFSPCPKDLAYEWQQGKVDDARHTTALSRFADSFRSAKPESPTGNADAPEIILPDCHPRIRSGEITELHLVLPQDLKTQKSLMGQIFTALTFVREPLCFEVIGTNTEIVVVLACATSDAPHVLQQLNAHEPDCVIDQTTDYLEQHWLGEDHTFHVVDFGLEHETMRPLASAHASYDALTGVMGALSGLNENECGILQILFQPARNSWSQALIESVSNYDGSAFFADAADMVPLAKRKTDSPLVACVIRAGASSNNRQRLGDMVRAIGGSLMQLRDPKSNGLFPLNNDEYHDAYHAKDLLARTSHRSGMLLNLEELTTIAHMPDASVRIPKLKRVTKRTKSAPDITKGHALELGVNAHHGEQRIVSIETAHRMRHMHLIGASGTGKSTMLLNMIRQDMEAGYGMAVLDPHGDLIDTALKYVPEHRLDDVIVFDPSDEEHPIGFNILDAHSELEKTLLASDLTSVFRRLSTSWGDQMNSVLANGIIAMLESENGGTLPTLRRFLVDKAFRSEHLKTVKDPENVFYWEREFPMLSGKPQGPVLTRLDTFLRPKPIRHMVAQQDNKIDFADIMQGKKIFLAKLAQGTIGAENSYLMGAFLVTKLNQMAFSRQAIQQSKRNPFYLYIDEFHNFITPSMESILSGTRKYNMGLVLAHQALRQLEGKDADVAASVLANPFTRVCFRLGDQDAKKLQNGFSFFDANDLQSLGIGQALARVERSEFDFNLQTPMLPEIDESLAKYKAGAIVRASRARYGTPREEVEALIHEALDSDQSKIRIAATKTDNYDAKKLPGRGGGEHKRIQQQIKKLGEEAGFKSTIEKPIRNTAGKITGHVDVALERDDLRLAVEISVSTSVEHELKNIRKCTDAGFDQIACLSCDPTALKVLRQAAGNIDQKTATIEFLQTRDLENLFEKLTDDRPRNHGYLVETEFLQNENAKQIKNELIKLVVQDQ